MATQARIDASFEVYKEHYGKSARAWCFVGTLHHIKGAPSMGGIGIAEFGIGGYSPTVLMFDNYNAAQDCADQLNKRLGLSVDDALKIVADTMQRPAGMRRF